MVGSLICWLNVLVVEWWSNGRNLNGCGDSSYGLG